MFFVDKWRIYDSKTFSDSVAYTNGDTLYYCLDANNSSRTSENQIHAAAHILKFDS